MEKAKEFILDDDNPTTCPYDGARTDLIVVRRDYWIEKCLECGEVFRFWIE
jgi:hypothetical protein